ncbi:hypothetical protein SS1G_08022 [Sclerotinia sclerotiorum 1980 UF-70]|nr:hypothetical protein SS1G_08022 [Sclerotinia sclerotiorum 1980 UF-70]APA08978.1 hypothetical protein sscle_04g037480 [Sclerotinia sclerotiorum 1980 UF-70]EDN92160.1 hypothetical protein SS1G_08022 [Sclerotinia sclerotiorum 1980 UF-70]
MDEMQKDEINREFNLFYSDTEKEEEYLAKLGLKHKRAYLFHGICGTGKSSLAIALATSYNLNVCSVDLKRYDPEDLKVVLRGVPKRSVVIYEDIRPSTFREYGSQEEGFPLSTFLNLLDGVASPEGHISIITTNYLKELDEFSHELLREGRINRKINFTWITQDQAATMFIIAMWIPEAHYNREDISKLASEFGQLIPEGKITHSAVLEYLVSYRGDPQGVVNNAGKWIQESVNQEQKGTDDQQKFDDQQNTGENHGKRRKRKKRKGRRN